MNLGEYVRTEEFPTVIPERVEPISIPEKMPVKEPQQVPAGFPDKEKSTFRIGDEVCSRLKV